VIIAVIMHGLSAFFEGEGEFRRTFEFVGYGFFPSLVGSLITVPHQHYCNHMVFNNMEFRFEACKKGGERSSHLCLNTNRTVYSVSTLVDFEAVVISYLDIFLLFPKALNVALLRNRTMPDEKLARALRARIRRRILKTIIDSGELSVTEISEKLEIGKYSASKHLKLLYDLGLVDVKEDPPRKLYRVTIPEVRELLEAYDKVVEAISKR